jgi:hypothetical protein
MLCRTTAIRPGLTGWVKTKTERHQAIDPVIGGAPQAEPFAGYVPAWQLDQQMWNGSLSVKTSPFFFSSGVREECFRLRLNSNKGT